MKRPFRHSLSALVWVALALTACGAADTAPPATATLPPPGQIIYVPGCGTRDLENWLENTYFLTIEFVNVTNQGVSQPPEALGPIVQRLADLRDMVFAVPTPDECAADTQRLITDMMSTTVTALQDFASGQEVDLNAMLAEVNTTVTAIQGLQSLLQQRLQAQFEAERGGP